MTKTSKIGKQVPEGASQSTKFVRNPKTGKLISVKGIGALKDSDLKLRDGLTLTKPIAEQTMSGRGPKAG